MILNPKCHCRQITILLCQDLGTICEVYLELLLLLLLLSHFCRVRLCATPQTAAYEAPVPGILQARTLEWVAISFSNA